MSGRRSRLFLMSLLASFVFVGCDKSDDSKLSYEDMVALRVLLVQKELETEQQEIFDAIHPLGEATGLKVHAVEHHETNTGDQVAIRLTLSWDGPITKEGFTKLILIYDMEAERYTDFQILATNGVTNEDAVTMLIGLAKRWKSGDN